MQPGCTRRLAQGIVLVVLIVGPIVGSGLASSLGAAEHPGKPTCLIKNILAVITRVN
jgi:hypothetical protein